MVGVSEPTMAFDAAIAVAATSLDAANVTAAVRAVRSAFCVPALVVMPVAIVTVQAVFAARFALPEVRMSFAVLVPDPDRVAANVVDPHPLVLGVARLASEKSGNTMLMTSPLVSNAFRANSNESAAAEDVIAGANTSRL
jgi:hypothetical protein